MNGALAEPVLHYITNAFRLELRSAGVKLGQGPYTVSLALKGLCVRESWLDTTYVNDISCEQVSAAPARRENVRISLTTNKFLGPSLLLAILRDVLAKNFDDVLRDPGFNTAMARYGHYSNS